MRFCEHIPTFFLLVATGLLMIGSVTAPGFSHVALVKVNLLGTGGTVKSSVSLGALGYCIFTPQDAAVTDSTAANLCSKPIIGYNVTMLVQLANPTDIDYSTLSVKSLDHITYALILHPIVTGLSFLAFFIACVSSPIGYYFAAFFAALAWLGTVLVFVLDNLLFAILRGHLIAINSTSTQTVYGLGIEATAGGLAALSLAAIFSLATCCCCSSGRRGFKKMKDEEKDVVLLEALTRTAHSAAPPSYPPLKN